MESNTLNVALLLAGLLGLVAVGLLRRYLVGAQLLRLRQMLHTERMSAIERGLPPPDAGAFDQVVMPLAGDIHWLRLGALCVGLFLVFAGAGICLGFGLSVDERTADAWSIGLIPAMSGLGLLVFHRLSASSTDTREPGRSA